MQAGQHPDPQHTGASARGRVAVVAAEVALLIVDVWPVELGLVSDFFKAQNQLTPAGNSTRRFSGI